MNEEYVEVYGVLEDISVPKQNVLATYQKKPLVEVVVEKGDSLVLVNKEYSWYLWKGYVIALENEDSIFKKGSVENIKTSDCYMDSLSVGIVPVNLEQVAVAYYVMHKTSGLFDCQDSDFSIFAENEYKLDYIACDHEANEYIDSLYGYMCDFDDCDSVYCNDDSPEVGVEVEYKSSDIVKALYLYLKSLGATEGLDMFDTFAYYCRKYNGIIYDSTHTPSPKEQRVVNLLMSIE